MKAIGICRVMLLERLENFAEARLWEVDDAMNELQQRSDQLKLHIISEKQSAVEKFDHFAHEVMATDKFDYLIKPGQVFEFEKVFDIDYCAQSTIAPNYD